MINHPAQVAVQNSAVDFDGIPMLFVHVVTWADLLVPVSQFECEIRVAFQIRSRWNFIERSQGEYFAGDLENENVLPERRTLGRAGLSKAIFAKGFEVHFAIATVATISSDPMGTRQLN
jgi:hypothetical protein